MRLARALRFKKTLIPLSSTEAGSGAENIITFLRAIGDNCNMVAEVKINNTVGTPDTRFIPPHIRYNNSAFPLELKTTIAEVDDYGHDRPGIPRCRDAIADDFNRRYGTNIKGQNVILTTGGRAAMSSAALRIAGKHRRRGNLYNPKGQLYMPKVLLMQPGYNLFQTQLEGFGYEMRFVNISGLNDEQKLAAIRRRMDEQVLLLPICSPNNPDGQIFSEYFLNGVLKLMTEFPRLNVVYDSIYAPIIREPGIKVPNIFAMAAGNEELQSRIYVVDALSKSYAWPSRRAGWVIAYSEEEIKSIQVYKDAQFGPVVHEAQMAVISALEFTPKIIPGYFDEVNRIYNARLELVHKKLHQIEGFIGEIPPGAIYYWANFSKMKNFHASDVVQAAAERGIALSPGMKFGEGDHIRINCGARATELEIICDNIIDICREKGAEVNPARVNVPTGADDVPEFARKTMLWR